MDASGQQGTNTQEHAKHLEKQQTTVAAQGTAPRRIFTLPIAVPMIRSRLTKLRINSTWRTRIGVSLYIITIALLVGGFLYWKFYINGLVTKSLSVGGYTYSFNFTRSAKYVQYGNGMRGYQLDSNHSALVGPVSGLPQLCGLKGSPYATAFTVQVYSQTHLVCTARDSHDNQIYTLSFAYQGAYHEFQVTYGYAQNPKDYPQLIKIFESITVSQ